MPPSHSLNAPARDWRFSFLGLSIILLGIVFCAWPGMHTLPFQDDVPQFEKSAHMSGWSDIFQPDSFNFYRPVKNAIFRLAAPWEKEPLVWHGFGLLAFLAATVGVYRITSIYLNSSRAALLATAVWALSPSCVSTVIWLSCANISIGIILAALVVHFHERKSAGTLVSCFVCYSLALLCYETMIAVPAWLFLRDVQQGRIAVRRQVIVRYGIYLTIALLFMLVRTQASAKSIGVNDLHSAFAPETTGFQLSLSAPWFLWRHFLMWIFPFGTLELLGSYAWLHSTSAAGLVFGWVFMAGLAGLGVSTWRRLPMFSFGILFYLVASIPAGNFLPGFNGPINDAYLTIPSIGLAVAFAALCIKLFQLLRQIPDERRSFFPILLATLVLLLTYRLPVCAAYFRYWATAWQDPLKLVVIMSDSRPYQFQLKAQAALLLYRAGLADEAETMANSALSDAPWSQHARLALARLADSRQNHQEAEAIYRTLLKMPDVDPHVQATSLIELAMVLADSPGRKEEAAALCREVLKLKHPGYPLNLRAVLMLAEIYQDQGNLAKARATLERGLTIHPNNELILKQLETLPPARK